ncbi:MAG: MFS transporter [Candidatus Peregrinibacteria bacterium]|nr:MFS transporter [Candidatus Peregrinibacteria bacterium]
MTHQKSHNSGFHHMIHLHIDKELLEVSVYRLFFYLAKNSVGLVLPFFLYKDLGYEIWQVFAFYFISQVAFFLSSPFIGMVISKLGIKHTLAFHSFAAVVFWYALPLVFTGDFMMDVLMFLPFFFLSGLSRMAADMAYDVFLTHHVHRESKGKVLAWLQIAMMLSGVIAPVVGAIIMVDFGFEFVTYLAFFLFFVSGVILFLTPDEKFKVNYSIKKLEKDILHSTPKNLFLAEIGYYFWDGILWVVWPLFLILVLKDVISMGALVGISSGIAMLVAFFVGKKIDVSNKEDMAGVIVKRGAVRAAFINFFRGIFFTPVLLGVVDCLNKINDQTIKVSHDYEVFKWLHEKDTFERAHIRRIVIESIYLFSVFIPMLLFYFLGVRYVDIIFVSFFLCGSLCLLLTSKVARLR